MAAPLARHPFGIRYILLWLGAWLVRLGASIRIRTGKDEDTPTLDSNVSRTKTQVPSRQKNRTIEVDVYEKVGQSREKKRYAHINFHGSGFIIPSLGSDVDFCTQLASTGTVVFDADYRKSPKHPFPAAFQDAEDVVSYVQAHGSDFDLAHLTIGGFSAGANIAMSVAVTSPPGLFTGVLSMYGNVDMTRTYPAPDTKNFESGAVLPEWLRAFFYKCLILPGQDRADPRLSPAYASLSRWPGHVFLACGTADSLHDSAKLMVQRLKDGGHGDVEFLSVEREAHAFDKEYKEGSQTEKRTRDMYRRAVETVGRAHMHAHE